MAEPVEPTGRAEPVPSLGDAWGLLLKSAAAQLRRVRPARRPPRAPAPAGVPGELRAPRRRIAPREVLTCLLLLLAIFGTAGGMTWWSWQTLQDRQVHLGGARDLRAEPDGRSLTGELVKREDRALEAGPDRKQPGSASLERPSSGLPKKSGGNVSLDGRIVAVVLIAAALGGATLLSRVVLRRYRQRALLATGPPERPSGVEREARIDPVPRQLGEAAELRESSAEAPAPAPGEAGLRADLLVEQRPPLPEESLRTVAPEPATLASVPLSSDSAAPSTAEQLALAGAEPPVASATWPVQPPAPADADFYAASDEKAPRERIFDRRATRRLPYVQPAWLWWADQNAPVTVQDVSLTGLRCLLSVSGAPSLAAPPLGGAVRIFFPVSGTTVKAAAELEWKEQTPRGLQIGLEFVDLPETDAELLRQLLLAES